MESPAFYDVLVLGGGPGGSTAATFLARAGKRVLLLEKEFFPRFHIGESLLPYNRQIFEEMGVLADFEAAGFIHKHGAQFHLGNGSKALHLLFRSGRFTKEKVAFQVERAKFDEVLLRHTSRSGVDVREGWTALRTKTDHSKVQVEARGPNGITERFEGAFLVDATGRSNLTGNQAGLRELHSHLRKVAVFGHFTGVRLDSGEKGGDTIIVRLENKWFWLIPISGEKVSVGCVMDQAELANATESPQELFSRIWQSSAPLRDRMQNAVAVGPIQTTSDFSYLNKRLVGPRLLRVGDAAGFMDPIFSAGVFLAMNSGKLAAKLIIESLAAGNDGADRLRAYEKRIYRSMQTYWGMVEHFYTKPFMEVFLEPRHRFDLPAAVTAILAGELEGGWPLWWRLQCFYWIVRLQAWLPLVPRISFG